MLTSTQWHDSDSWVHGRHAVSGAIGGFPPSKIAQPQAPPLSGFDPDVIAVRTGSIRGAGWGKFFEQVKSDTEQRQREEQAAHGVPGTNPARPARQRGRFGPIADALGDQSANKVGVFCCGPMGADLRANCMKYGDVAREGEEGAESTVFQLHAEVF